MIAKATNYDPIAQRMLVRALFSVYTNESFRFDVCFSLYVHSHIREILPGREDKQQILQGIIYIFIEHLVVYSGISAFQVLLLKTGPGCRNKPSKVIRITFRPRSKTIQINRFDVGIPHRSLRIVPTTFHPRNERVDFQN